MKKFSMLLLVVLGVFALSSCSFNILAPKPEIRILYNGGEVGPVLTYEVEVKDDGGLSFQTTGMSLAAYAEKGSVGATLTGYRLDFYFADGTPVYAGDIGSINGPAVRVPPGLTCELPSLPGAPIGQECTVNSKNVQYVRGQTVEWTTLPGIPSQIAYILYQDGRPDNGAFAQLTAFIEDDIGRRFEITQEITINATGVFRPSSLDAQ